MRDQVLARDQVPSMDSLITKLLRVPHVLKDENLADVVETSVMVAPRGRGGRCNSSFSKIPHFVTVANGSKVVSQGSGQVSLSPSLKLNSVLFIPQHPYNLISLSQLTRLLNCSVTFNANSFVIQEHGTGQLIGEGRESRGLYYLESNFPMSYFATSKPKLLHDRVGLPSLPKLKMMVSSLKNLRLLECESCQLGKHVRSSFSQIVQRCNSAFSTIHSDIWGPSRVTSFGF